MKKRHLHLVVSKNECYKEKQTLKNVIKNIKNHLFCMFISKEEKIYILKDFLIKIYRDYELSTGYKDVPYYIRADIKISKIIQQNKIDYYYKLSKKFQNR